MPAPARSRIILLLALVLALFLPAAETLAQSVADNSVTAGTPPGGTNPSGTADAEFWRAIRSGETGTVVGQNELSGRLIQSDGHLWEQTRNGPLAMYTTWILLGTVGLLALFFALRGRILVDSGLSGRMIRRFSRLETAAHWMLAISFIILALTGLNLLFGRNVILPLIGPDLFHGLSRLGKLAHNYVGFAFTVALVLIFVLWFLRNIPRPRDLVWLLRGGGLFGGGHPAAGKFNAGQKMIFWSVVLVGGSVAVSGWALLNPFSMALFSPTFSFINGIFGTSLPTDLSPMQEQQFQQIWHAAMAVLLMAIALAHMYIGSVGMQGASGAMTHGQVDINWAREHHSLWVEEVGEGAPAADSQTPTRYPIE